MPKAMRKTPNPPIEADPKPNTIQPTEAELFALDNIFSELCIGYNVLIDARNKRQMSINYFTRCEAQGSLPPNLRFKLAMYQWPICFKTSDAEANHLIEVAILDEALKKIALNRKTVLERDLLSITDRITNMKLPNHVQVHLDSSRRELSVYNDYLTEMQLKLDDYIGNFNHSKKTLLNLHSEPITTDIHDDISDIQSEINSTDRKVGVKTKPTQHSTLKPKSKKQKNLLDSDQSSVLSADPSITELTNLVQSLAATVASQTSAKKTSETPVELSKQSTKKSSTSAASASGFKRHAEHFQNTAAWLNHNNSGMFRQNSTPFTDSIRSNYSSSSNNRHYQANPPPNYPNTYPPPPNTPQNHYRQY